MTTKDGTVEDPDDLVARIEEASGCVPLERPAVGPQCAFASGVIGAMTAEQQEAAADRRRRTTRLGLA